MTARRNLVVLAAMLVGLSPVAVRAQTATPVRSSGAIEGAVFDDTNGNGVFDLEEMGVDGVTITLTGDGSDRTTQTDDGGVYRFADVANGTYTVAVEPEAPYHASDRTRYEGLEVEGDTLASVDFALASNVTATVRATAEDEATATPAATDSGSGTGDGTATTTAPTAETATTVTATEPVTSTATSAATMGVPTAPVYPTAPAYPTPMTGAAPVMGSYVTPMPAAADQMPKAGFEDLGGLPLLGLALAVLLALAAVGWWFERR